MPSAATLPPTASDVADDEAEPLEVGVAEGRALEADRAHHRDQERGEQGDDQPVDEAACHGTASSASGSCRTRRPSHR